MNRQLQTHLIAAAIGATIGVISAAGIFLYQKIIEKQHGMKNSNVRDHLDDVDRRLTELQEELERLRLQQNQQRRKKKHRRDNDSTLTATENDTDAFSTAGTDIGEDEFFDCSDSENGMSDVENRTAEATCSGLDLSIYDTHFYQRGHAEEDYLALKTLADTYPDDVDVLWRYARSCYKYLNCITDSNMKKAIISAGINCCEKLLPKLNGDLHKWCAILVGVYGDYLPTAEKIKNGYRFKDLVMEALEICPSDSELHHLLGRFKYEVANLSWIEKKVAATLFSEVPSASYDDALESFKNADTFSSKLNLENHLFLSKCYIATSKYESACFYLEQICEATVVTEDDEKIQNEARQLFAKYSRYR